MGAPWEEALDAQLDCYLYVKSDRGRRYTEGWGKSFAREGDGFAQHVAPDLPERIAVNLLDAEPFWVSPDIQLLWESSVDEFKPEPLLESDLLTQDGFVVLSRPYTMTDIHGTDQSFRAFMWNRVPIRVRSTDGVVATRMGVTITTFHRIGDADYNDSGTGVRLSEDGVFLPYERASMRRGDLQIDHLMPWVFGMTYERGEMEALLEANYTLHPINVQQPVQCMLRLMQQTVVARGEGRASKPFRRRWERERLEPKGVTVIRLRRPSGERDPEHQPGAVEWKGRWIVRGFWRNQWYPSLSTHRQIYVHPFVKGPEDKPLMVPRARVFEVVR